jgi:hypothetical protein
MSRARDYTLQLSSKILSRSVSNITNAAHEENGQSLFFLFIMKKWNQYFLLAKILMFPPLIQCMARWRHKARTGRVPLICRFHLLHLSSPTITTTPIKAEADGRMHHFLSLGNRLDIDDAWFPHRSSSSKLVHLSSRQRYNSPLIIGWRS